MLRLSALCQAGAVLVTVAAGPTSGGATTPEKPLISLSCPSGSDRAETACQAMFQALARAAPGYVIRGVARGEESPGRPGDIGLALHLGDGTDHSLTGHLTWQAAGDDAAHTGPEIRIDAMDATLSRAGYDQFADGLIKADPDLSDALKQGENR